VTPFGVTGPFAFERLTMKKQTAGRRAAIYCRVSTDGQRDNSSPASQLDRARLYSAERDYDVITEKFEIISGSFILARSEFNDLLTMGGDGLLDVIIVDIPDRLGRGDAISNCEMLAKMNGIRVEYAQPGYDDSTPEGLVMGSASKMVSGLERQNIRRRTMQGKKDWAGRGRIIANGHRPYGYEYQSTYDALGRKQTCVLAVVPEEASTVANIYEWLVYEGMSMRGIARRLSDAGIPTTRGKANWALQVVHGILTSTTYKGEWRYGKEITTRLDTPEGVKHRILGQRGAADVVTVPCPVLVAPELWESAQAQLRENLKKFVKPTVNEYYLRGRVQCAHCESKMSGTVISKAAGKGTRYYRCWKADAIQHSGTCHNRRLNAGLAERLVWETVVEALEHPDRLFVGAAERRKEAARARRLIEQALAGLELQAAKDKAGLERVFEMVRDGDAPKSKYREETARVEKREKARAEEQADLDKRLAQTTVLSEEDEAYILAFAAGIANRLHPDVPSTEKAKLYDLLRVACIFDGQSGEFVVSGLMGRHTLSAKSSYNGQCVPFITAWRISDGKAERLADALFEKSNHLRLAEPRRS
jgi:site-specific DNA recombinase